MGERFNHDMYQLHEEIDIVKSIEINLLRWLGQVWRMDEDRIPSLQTKKTKVKMEIAGQSNLKSEGLKNVGAEYVRLEKNLGETNSRL